MTTWVVIAASLLAGVWLIETLAFVLTYRLSARTDSSEQGR